MNNRDYYKVTYSIRDSDKTSLESQDILDNDTEFNANQFKLYDDFTTDLRISFNPLRQNYHDVTRRSIRRTSDKNDSGIDMENGNPHDDSSLSKDADLLENEVMVDPWSSMDSSNSPLTDSGPSASDDCTPSTSSEVARGSSDVTSPVSSATRRTSDPIESTSKINKNVSSKTDKARSRDLTLELETLDSDPLPRRPHFLDECRIPKPHFLDHSPSPDEFDERSDITNPNFLDDEVDGDDNQAHKKSGALPKRPQKTFSNHEDRPHRTSYRSTLHYGLESAARSSERDKRASQLYRGTWPGERDVWMGHDSASVRSFSSNGSADGARAPSNLENKMECVCSLISLLSLSPENNADLSGPLLDMSRSVESCIAMRQAGCIPLLVQLIHSKVARETRDRAAKALRNIIHTQTDDKAGRREARVWRLLEQVREYCYVLEDLVESRKEGKEPVEDDATKHPSQSVAALMKLSFDEEHRHVVCQLGGLQALAALVSGDQAAHGSRTDDNTCLTMRKYAGMTLTNLTFGDGNNKSLLCSFKDFMLALVEQLESPNDDMRQVTAAVLRNLSWRADTNSKQVLREVGAVKGLTKAAMTCQKEATLKSVLSALWNLTAHCSLNKVALCSVDGALGFLVDMLSYNSPTKTLAIVENAGGIMRNVSSHIAVREDYRQILRERNCLSVLLQHLKSPSLTVVSNSCGTLWNLSARCPQDQQFLWDHGAVPMLRSLIHSKHKMIAMGSGAALKNLLNSKPGKTHIISLDTTARSMNLPALPTLGARKQKALEQELDQNLAETCDNIEPATSPSTSNREEKNLFTATERQIAMNLERHRMTSSSPLMGTLTSQISLSHSAHLASYLSCSNTLLKGALVTRSNTGSAGNVNRSDSKDSVTSTHSDTVFERVMRTGKVPVPTPRNKDLMKSESTESYKASSSTSKEAFVRYSTQPPVPTPRSSTELRTNYTESGFDVDQDSCDQPIDYSRKYSETKTVEVDVEKPKTEIKKYAKKESPSYGDYQETDLDQPTDYSLRYGELQSETGSDTEPPIIGPSINEDTIQHFATEGTPYETPIIFSTATSMSDLRVIGKEKPKMVSSVKENPEIMTHSDEKDTCSIEDPPHDNDLAATTPQSVQEPIPEKRGIFDTKFSSGMISPEKPVNYCDEGTPGYFSRVSSLSSLGEPTEEDSLAKRNALATIASDPSPPEQNSSIAKDREGCKAVTFASSPVTAEEYVEETPLMFSRSSSLGSVPDGDQNDDQVSVVSELSRMTSGCLSPSEIPDSPGVVSPPAPPAALSRTHSPPPEQLHIDTDGACPGSVFEERVSQFVVENTPAQFSTNTSLSSLTIDIDAEDPLPKLSREKPEPSHTPPTDVLPVRSSLMNNRSNIQQLESRICNDIAKDGASREEVVVFVTEDTPGVSFAGSRAALSPLGSPPPGPPRSPPRGPPLSPPRSAPRSPPRARSDSSNSSILSDGDLLEECIQKGIAKVVKNKAPPSEASTVMNPYRDNVYRSLPAYLRSSTETVKMSHEFARNMPDSRSGSSETSPPPLPPRVATQQTTPPAHHGPKPVRGRARRRRSSSGSSPSGESFGSAERELFAQVVRAGERPRAPSLSDLSNDSFGSTDKEVFERCVRLGMKRARSLERRRARGAAAAPKPAESTSKNVESPSAERAPAGERGRGARAGCDRAGGAGGAGGGRGGPGGGRGGPGGGRGALPDVVAVGGGGGGAPDLTSRLAASPAIEREAARLAAALAPPAAPASLLELVAPPPELAALDMDASLLSVASLVSEAAPPLAFELGAPVQDFLQGSLLALPDLDAVNPPSLFDEMMESTLDLEPAPAPLPQDKCPSLTLPATELPSDSEANTPLPSDLSSVESTPKRRRDPTHLTPKERRQAAKDRFQTYTIMDVVPAPPAPREEPAPGEPAADALDVTTGASRRRGTARQRRAENRARYQTQTVEASTLLESTPPRDAEALRRTSRQRRRDDAERFRTRTLSDDVPPPPAAKDNFDHLETTTGYDSLSSNEPSHQQLAEPADADSGLTEDDDLDLCLVRDLRAFSDHDSEPDERPKPKIVNPTRRERSLDSNESLEPEPEPPKAIRGRKKALYVSPYRRSAPPAPRSAPARAPPRPAARSAPTRPQTSAKPLTKTPVTSKPPSANTSPKKSIPHASPSKVAKTSSIPAASKPLPLERQGTFTKDSSAPPPAGPAPPPAGPAPPPAPMAPPPAPLAPPTPRLPKSAPATKATTSPSRLPQMSRYSRPAANKQPNRSPTKIAKKPNEPMMKNSASNHSLQSNESGKTITLASRSSRQGSTSSVNSVQSSKTKDVESKIANLWKKVEQAKKQPSKVDKRVWIESDKMEPPRLIRSSTFEGQPKQTATSPAGKQKSAIGIRVSQIPSLRPKSTPNKTTPNTTAKKPTTTGRMFARKPISTQVTS